MSGFDSERFAVRESVLNTVLGAALGSNLVSEVAVDRVRGGPVDTIWRAAKGGLAFALAAFLMFLLVFGARRVARQLAERKPVSSLLVFGYVLVGICTVWLPGTIRGLGWQEVNIPLLYIVATWLPLYLLVGWYSQVRKVRDGSPG